jgi:hypothetical protein
MLGDVTLADSMIRLRTHERLDALGRTDELDIVARSTEREARAGRIEMSSRPGEHGLRQKRPLRPAQQPLDLLPELGWDASRHLQRLQELVDVDAIPGPR